MWAKIKAAVTRSWTVAWLGAIAAWGVISPIASMLLDILSMPEAAQLVQTYRPSWSTVFIVVVGILARLRTLKLS